MAQRNVERRGPAFLPMSKLLLQKTKSLSVSIVIDFAEFGSFETETS